MCVRENASCRRDSKDRKYVQSTKFLRLVRRPVLCSSSSSCQPALPRSMEGQEHMHPTHLTHAEYYTTGTYSAIWGQSPPPPKDILRRNHLRRSQFFPQWSDDTLPLVSSVDILSCFTAVSSTAEPTPRAALIFVAVGSVGPGQVERATAGSSDTMTG